SCLPTASIISPDLSPMKAKKFRLPRSCYLPLSILFWVGVWWLLAAVFDKPLLLPTPWAVLCTLGELIQTGDFWATVALSLARILCGILLALLAGSLLALLTVKSPFCHHLFSPVLTLCKATPVASVIFLVLLWVGRDQVPLLIALVMALPIVWSNVREGLLQTDRKLLEMAQVFGLSKKDRLLAIRIPSLYPYFLAACRSAIALAWKAGIAAEVLCLPKSSIGLGIYEGKMYLETDRLFAWTLVVVVISALIEWGALALLKKAQKHTYKEEARV
ncbi:MAG: ABC transporter permease subunit, partial [Clostridia bacterium]|nr:ABC transporter permease subunit [Clostridia bacterium]